MRGESLTPELRAAAEKILAARIGIGEGITQENMQLAQELAYFILEENRVPLCMNCGLPQTKNTHAMAGKPSHVNIVGAEWGCLPCAEIRANGRADLFYRLKRLLADRIRSNSSITPETVLCFMESWEEERILARIRSAMESGAIRPNDEGPKTKDEPE